MTISIPANFNTATLSPRPAMVPNLRALPLMPVVMDEKVSEVLSTRPVPRIVVDVYCYGAEG